MQVPAIWRFEYDNENNKINFYLAIGDMRIVIGLLSTDFLNLVDAIVQSGGPFLASVKEHIANNIQEDIKTDFDPVEWEKLWENEGKNPKEG